MTALIIDDEKKARNVLKILIEENCTKINTIIEAENLIDGINIIKSETPNIVFLDIEMPEHSGLELLDFIEKEIFNFEIIFTTAYSEYAIQAFQLSAIDYLLKPIKSNELKQAVDKALKFMGKSQTNLKLEELKSVLANNNFNKIALPVSEGITFIEFENIVTLKADGMYTKISTNSEGELLISKPLKHFVELLQKQPQFYKPHRSYLINLKYIKSFIKKDGGYILMDNGETVSISKDKRYEFFGIVSQL